MLRYYIAHDFETMGKDPDDFDWVRDRPGHDRRYAIDSSKLRRELGSHAASTASTEAWWRPAKAATEARYKAQGR